MLHIVGYVIFVLVRILGGCWFALPLLPLVALAMAGITALLPRNSPKPGVIVGAVMGGILDGLFVFGLAALIGWLFPCSYAWLIGIGIAGTVIASPKILNARYVVPVSVATALLLFWWLIF